MITDQLKELSGSINTTAPFTWMTREKAQEIAFALRSAAVCIEACNEALTEAAASFKKIEDDLNKLVNK